MAEVEETPMSKFRNKVGFQIQFILHSGLDIETAIDHICGGAEKLIVAAREAEKERCARETCPTCKAVFERPEAYLVGAAQLEGKYWVHPWIDGSARESELCVAARIRKESQP